MFYLLSRRSKVIRGFKEGKFYLEFSRVFFICAVIDMENIELPTIYSINDINIQIDLNTKAFFTLMQLFEENPL
jgi:hypothetical protein